MNDESVYFDVAGYVEHGWLCSNIYEHPIIMGTWVEGQPEARRPIDKYEPVKVTRMVTRWVRPGAKPETLPMMAEPWPDDGIVTGALHFEGPGTVRGTADLGDGVRVGDLARLFHGPAR